MYLWARSTSFKKSDTDQWETKTLTAFDFIR
jgi:hypothetical protein